MRVQFQHIYDSDRLSILSGDCRHCNLTKCNSDELAERRVCAEIQETERQIGVLFTDIARFRANLYDRAISSIGLTFTQAMALNHLMVHDGLTQVELARNMNMGTVTISGIVDRLEAGKWVVRKPSKSDRRAKTVWLTDKVKSAKAQMTKVLSDLNDLSLQGFNDDHITELATTLQRIKLNLVVAINKTPTQ